ncbi:hypothetical protein F5884DRAFT_824048 [Xylogone sp. PMI_703]|nr:hypothetical protein F5884DRAFT_824048 [Xylogone sp. PMI_703]
MEMPPTISSDMGRKHLEYPLDSETDSKQERVARAIRSVLEVLGENPKREGLTKTPNRFAKAMLYFTHGYARDPTSVLKDAMFQENHKGLVLVRDIDFSSLCEHHLVPFIGKVHIGYIPDGRVVGLSKMARLTEVFARRLQVQERLTTEIAHCMFDVLQPRGVAVVVEASHRCMVMRGVQKTGATTVTTCMLGVFDKEKDLRDDFWQTLRR